MKNSPMLPYPVLVRDPEIIALFGGAPPVDEYTPPTEESLAEYERYAELMRAKAEADFAIDFGQDEPATEPEIDPDKTSGSSEHCHWGRSRLSRFLTRYISWYKKPPSKDRTFFLEQLEQTAKENHVKLPSSEELNARTPKKRMVVDHVELNRSYVYNLKAYSDGENIIAYLPGENKAQERELHPKTRWDALFDILYADLKNAPENSEFRVTREKKQSIREHIEAELVRQLYEIYGYDDAVEDDPCPLFVSRKLWNIIARFNERKKRFFRKKDQVKWTAWWTITYDDEKFSDPEEFRKKLKTYFRNKAFRADWRVMGVFEHGEDNGRLHFHGFFYIPAGKEVGELVNRKHYSTKNHEWHEYVANTEFEELFGINEYEDIRYESEAGKTAYAKYTAKMLSYMNKGEKIFYSRHIPSEFDVKVYGDEIMCSFTQIVKRKVKRCVLWNDAFVQSDMSIERKDPTRSINREYCIEIGLLDEAA